MNKTAFVTKYVAGGSGEFRDEKPITAADLRTFVTDISNTFTAPEDTTLETTKVVTSAEILSANSTPVELIGAPGAGNSMIVDRIIAIINFNSAAYATNTTFEILSGGTSITGPVSFFLDAVDSKVLVITIAIAEFEINQPLVFQVNDGDPTDGDSDVTFIIRNKTITL